MERSAFARFMPKVKVTEGCWNWTAATNEKGYGVFRLRARRNQLAHGASYEHFVGPVPDGLVLDHLCENPRCVRPDHLEPVTNAENRRRARVTHCLRGHPYPLESVTRPSGTPLPGCLECIREHQRRYRRERRKLSAV